MPKSILKTMRVSCRDTKLGPLGKRQKCLEEELYKELYDAYMLVFRSKVTNFARKSSIVMSATISLFHIVINTLGREMTIPDQTSEHMYKYITAIVKNRNCKLFHINGIANHVHMLVGLSPSVALSDLVRDIKQGSSKWAKQQIFFPDFRGWGKEYGAFSCSVRDIDAIINYIKNQRIHHGLKTFEQEYQDMIERSGLEWNDYRLT